MNAVLHLAKQRVLNATTTHRRPWDIAMLKRAAASYASGGETAQQRLMKSSFPTNDANTNKVLKPNGNSRVDLKRKFDRSFSSQSAKPLNQLHSNVYFEENDFDDDGSIDLDYSVKTKGGITAARNETLSYPKILSSSLYTDTIDQIPITSIDANAHPVPLQSPSSGNTDTDESSNRERSVSYPKLPPVPSVATSEKTTSAEERPAKRKALPWSGAALNEEKEENIGSEYPWNKSALAVKNEQKEFRRKRAANTLVQRPQENIPVTHLSQEQVAVTKAVVEDGKSVFFTGSAGTGKSVLMRAIIAKLKKKFTREPDRLAVTASTGLAACVIEGSTLHSWAGIGLGKEPVPELCKKIKRNAKTKTKWLRTKVLIIDEISMVDGELFDKLEAVARTIRNNGKPFGGIQLVVTGDFFQLPPVPEKNAVAKFAFDAATWNTCIEHVILLTHVFRQKDPDFANMLNEMRLGRLTPASIRNFQKLSRPLDITDEIEATELFPTRGEVENANTNRMHRLIGAEQVFDAVDSGVSDERVRANILANFMAPAKLTLKKGAQVMLIKNIDEQLVNGTLGKIVAFMDEPCYQAYRDDEETYHLAHEEPGGSDEEEKAAARLKFNAARYKNKDGPSPKQWPMVRFPLADGTYRDMLCMPEEWKTESQQGEIVAKRVQIPLILAWALSIHKAQGQTLTRVKVDLGKVFEKGQAYVALSRATSQAGLQVLRFDARKVMVHPKVITFYEKLVSIHTVMKK